MNTIKKYAFAALTALAATLLFQTSLMRADDRFDWGDNHGRGDRGHGSAKATFSKWLIGSGPFMEGVVGGDVGKGTYTGEILKYGVVAGPGGVSIQKIEALYHFTGSKHSFSALVHVEQTGFGTGTKAVITGVVIDGWLKNRAVEGKYTQKSFIHEGVPTAYFEGSLEIE